MEKFQKLSKPLFIVLSLFISFAILGSIFVLPSFALDEYVPFTLSADELAAVIRSGDAEIVFTLTPINNSSYQYRIFSYLDGSDLLVDNGQSFTYRFPSPYPDLTLVGSLGTLMISGPIGVRNTIPQDGYLQLSYDITLPFDLYLGPSSGSPNFNLTVPYPGPEEVGSVYSQLDFERNGFNIASFNSTSTSSIVTWSGATLFQTYHSIYPLLPSGQTFDTSSTGARALQNVTRIDAYSSDYKAFDTIKFSQFMSNARSSLSSNLALYSSPFAFLIRFGQFYILQSQQDQIVEYLDIITSDSPSAAQQQRIDQLRREFSQAKQTMEDIDDQLHVDMPDTDDLALSEEQNEQIQEAVEYAVSPLFDNPVIVTLVSGALVFALIKLLLFGGGPS